MTDFNLALTESRSLRSEHLSRISNEKALSALNKAKSIVMALWEGESVATTSEIAHFYEVTEETARQSLKRHRVEFESDGLKSLRGKELKGVRDILSLSPNSPNETLWNPRSAIRLGMILRDSDVAKTVRDVLLDLVEVVPAQNERIRELELQNAVLDKQIRMREIDNSMLLMHGAPTVLALRGQADQVVPIDRPTLEVIDKRCGDRRKGMTTKQLNEYLKQKTGIQFKSGADVERYLQRHAPELIDLVQRPVNQSFVNEENIERAIDVLSHGSRQTLIGECRDS
jgi:hypothetical protein